MTPTLQPDVRGTLTLTAPTPVYPTARAARRARARDRPTLAPGTYRVREAVAGAIRTPAGWITA